MTEPEQALRAAFEAAAGRVDGAPDALGAIRTRVGVRARRRRVLAVSLAGLATVAVVASGIAVSSGSTPGPSPAPVGSSAGVPPSTRVTPAPSTPDTAVAVRLPVYFIGATDRLYREFRDTTVAADTLPDRIGAGGRLALAGSALDPDYRSAWPAGVTMLRATVDGGVATLELAGPAPTDPLAAQQFVYTTTAVAADFGTQLSGVRLLLNGIALGGVLERAPEVDTLGPLWLVSPQEGETVARTVDVYLTGSVFEAAARVRVRDAGGAVVRDVPVLLSIGAPTRGVAHEPLTLEPGRYTIEVYFVAARDGTEQGLDGHTVTVS